jgi:outer membrane protein assembly factor BamE (lipoprotein component of BamABCDE complex)
MKHLFIVLCVLFLFGCSTVGNSKIADQTVTDQIKVGKTTKGEVREIVGEPNKTSFDGNFEIWDYMLSKAQLRATSLIPVVGLFVGGTNIQQYTFTVRFDEKGIVQNVGSGQSKGGAGSVTD